MSGKESTGPFSFDIPITHGKVMKVGESRNYQAHAAPVSCPEHIKYVLDKLNRLKKWRTCVCRPCAFRIAENVIVEQSDDGNDLGAGEKLLYLLQRWDVQNILLVVTGWNVGGHLSTSVRSKAGITRYRVLIDSAKQVLEQCYFESLGIASEVESKSGDIHESYTLERSESAPPLSSGTFSLQSQIVQEYFSSERLQQALPVAHFPLESIKRFGSKGTVDEGKEYEELKWMPFHFPAILTKAQCREARLVKHPSSLLRAIFTCIARILEDSDCCSISSSNSWPDLCDVVCAPTSMVDLRLLRSETVSDVRAMLEESSVDEQTARNASELASASYAWIECVMSAVRAAEDPSSAEQSRQESFISRKTAHQVSISFDSAKSDFKGMPAELPRHVVRRSPQSTLRSLREGAARQRKSKQSRGNPENVKREPARINLSMNL